MNNPSPRTSPSERVSPDDPLYVISVAAELVGVHPQTLRGYERAGLVTPSRTAGGTRRYSANDITRLRRIQTLTDQGVPHAGVARILELERRLDELSGPSTALVPRTAAPHRNRTSSHRTLGRRPGAGRPT